MSDADAVDLGLLALRCVVGVVMLAHGINHVIGGGRIPGTARWFESLGMRPGRLHAWLASGTEIAAGVLLVLGLLTPLAAAGVVGVLVVAWITNHRGNGFFIFRPGEGWEYVMTLTVVALAIGAVGPGSWSAPTASHSPPPSASGAQPRCCSASGGARRRPRAPAYEASSRSSAMPSSMPQQSTSMSGAVS
jgi:putative oxidoreductase